MNLETLDEAIELAKHVGHVFVATADTDGLPHVATAAKLELLSADRIGVSSWFCPGTMANVQSNPRIALVVWDGETDTGYQIFGEVEQVRDLAILDGYSPDLGRKGHLPQVERELFIRPDRIIAFSQAPHSDVEE